MSAQTLHVVGQERIPPASYSGTSLRAPGPLALAPSRDLEVRGASADSHRSWEGARAVQRLVSALSLVSPLAAQIASGASSSMQACAGASQDTLELPEIR